MQQAKSGIKYADVSISDLRIRRVTNGLVLEVPEQDSAKEADTLAERLRAFYTNEEEIKVSHLKKVDFIICDFDDSKPGEVAAAVASLSGCDLDIERIVTVGRLSHRTTGSI